MKKSTQYTFLCFELNSLLDRGQTLNPGETWAHIEDGSLFDWLKETFKNDFDLSLYTAEELTELIEFLQSLVGLNTRKKMGVENNGISILLALCVEGIQRLDD